MPAYAGILLFIIERITNMTLIERFELFFIGIVAATVWLFAFLLPTHISAGQLFLYISVLILSQSLIRDLSILFSQRSKRHIADETTKQVVNCMCVESTVGITGVIIGALLLSTRIIQVFTLNSLSWLLIALITLLTGFVMKNYVIQWSPWKIRKEKDHINIIFSWKK